MNKILILSITFLMMLALALPAQEEVTLPVRHKGLPADRLAATQSRPYKANSAMISAPSPMSVEFRDITTAADGSLTPTSALLTITTAGAVDVVDLGEYDIAVYNTVASAAWDFSYQILVSKYLDAEKVVPIWWAYVVTDAFGREHSEIHLMNTIIYQGNRWLLNSLPAIEQKDEIWQRCQY